MILLSLPAMLYLLRQCYHDMVEKQVLGVKDYGNFE